MSSIVDINGNPIAEQASGYHQASGGFADELQSWQTYNQSADMALLPTFDQGNARASDLARNDGYAKSGVQLHIDHIVGHQFKLVYKPNFTVLGIDPKVSQKFAKEVEAKFTDFAEDSNCFIDAEEKRNFTMLIREAIGTHCKTGEITAKAEWFKRRGSKFKTSIKFVDYARISNPDGNMNSSKLRAGVKLNVHGAPVGYYVRKRHPNDMFLGDGADDYRWIYIPKKMPWGRLQFIHIFEPQGESQTRGANEFLATLAKLKMLDKFQSTTLQNAIVNAMYSAVIESDLNSDEVFKALGGGQGGNNDMLNNFMNAKTQWHDASKIKLAGVKIPHLLPTEKLKLQNVQAPSSSLGEFESGILRYISGSLGVSYEQLSRDFSKTNYSSARASMAESFRYFLGKRKTIAERFASHIFELWLEEAINIGEIKLPAGSPSFYDAKSAWCKCDWIGAGATEIDGLKGVKESVERIKAGLSTYEAELGKQGKDYQEVFAQQEREKEMLAEHGRTPIWLNSEANPSDDGEDDEKVEEININPEVHTNE